jgi:hypothetical protein
MVGVRPGCFHEAALHGTTPGMDSSQEAPATQKASATWAEEALQVIRRVYRGDTPFAPHLSGTVAAVCDTQDLQTKKL